jgi:hypothetical protein
VSTKGKGPTLERRNPFPDFFWKLERSDPLGKPQSQEAILCKDKLVLF